VQKDGVDTFSLSRWIDARALREAVASSVTTGAP
jgi:hypothetical protein